MRCRELPDRYNRAVLTFRQAFGRVIRSARDRRGWSQQDLADRLGSTQANVWKLENGSTDFRLSTMVAVAKVFGRKASEWLSEVEREMDLAATLPVSEASELSQ